MSTHTEPAPARRHTISETDAPRWPAEYAARYRAAGYWRGETFGGVLRQRAEQHPDRAALVNTDGLRVSYEDLDRRVDRLAAGLLSQGVQAGDRVVVHLPNVVEFFDVVFALFRIGALPVFALPAHRFTEIAYFCAFSEAVAYVAVARHDGFDYAELGRQVADEVPTLRHVLLLEADEETETGPQHGATALESLYQEPVPVSGPEPHDVAFLQLSGGSTGVPKLIPRTHDDYIYSLRGSNEICAVGAETVYLCVLPCAHNFPLSSPGTLGVLYGGGRVVLAPQPSPDVAFPLIERERVTMAAVVPPLAMVWLDAADSGLAARHDLTSLRVLQVGGAKFAEEAARRVTPALGCALQQVFGMAEGLVNYTRLDDPEELVLTTQGRPISPDDEVLVLDDDDQPVPDGTPGNLLTRGPYTIRGYFRVPEHNAHAFTADGFYRTGDIVRRTPSGYLTVEGRAKEQINRGGEKVAPEEVENHLLGHPAVHDAAVVAVPDPYLGERTCAYVVRRDTEDGGADTTPVKGHQLKRFVRERGLAAYKVPDRVEFVSAFPHTGVGKTSKKDLRSELAMRMARGDAGDEPRQEN